MNHWINRWQALWHPERFHGWGRERRYFEGWYFKLVTADERRALAFIPGISYDSEGVGHAFVQVMDGTAAKAYYHRYAASDFQADAHRFRVQVGGNIFSGDELILDLPGIQGRVSLEGRVPWPKMLGAPGIMGWYSFVPFMECFHGVVSMHHTLRGRITFDGNDIDFNGGKGYIEKDWGRSFPRAYIWMQTNHFASVDRASLMASAAHIPWLNGYFIGYISGFWLDGRLFRFATYTGAQKHLHLLPDAAELIFKSPKEELRLLAKQAPGVALVSPLSGAMTGKVNESLQAEVQVELLEGGKRIFEDTGRCAGLELAGDLPVLLG